MWDQLNTESEKIKRFFWLFLLGLLAIHAGAILLVLARLQNLIFILAILSAFFIVAQVGRIKIWLTTVSAGVLFGLLPIAQTAVSAEKFSLLAWKAIMHTALGTSLTLLLMAEIPFRGDASLALAFDTVLMVLALVSMTYIEVDTKWYPTIVRSLAVLIIAIILMEVTLGIAYPELNKPDRWWKFLEFAKDHWIIFAILIGIPLFLWKKVSIPTIPIKAIIGLAILFFGISMMFQGPRDWLLDKVNRSEIPTAITGTETVRSVLVEKFDGFDICDLKPETSYTFVEVRTEYSDKTTYRIRNKTNGEIVSTKVTGTITQDASKHPYRKADYDFGILVNGVPPGRRVETNSTGCLRGSFNTPLTQYFEMEHSTGMGIHLRN